MDQAWLQQRAHLAPLARSLDAILKLADEQYKHGRASGDAVDYAEFEERVAHATARSEHAHGKLAINVLEPRTDRVGARKTVIVAARGSHKH